MKAEDFGIHGCLGFGCMRLPMIGGSEGQVDVAQTRDMVDCFMEHSFNYFDTAHGYIGGKSETALKECLTSRYPRHSYLLADKLSPSHFEREEDIRPLFQRQLDACGVEYFDFYLMHAQNKKLFEKYKSCRAYETAMDLKREGKIRHLGISFHDSAAVLDEILTAYPQIEVVQIQLNYADYEDPIVQSHACYEVCRRHGKPVIVMEPVKGGLLVNLPDEAEAVFAAMGGSPASYALRFAASHPDVITVLSGMSDLAMMEENVSVMERFAPIDAAERDAIARVRAILAAQKNIACTACRYCVDGCPANIPVPALFSCHNNARTWKNWNGTARYQFLTKEKGKASDCIGCGACEDACPQSLPIRELLTEIAREFEGDGQ